MLSRKISQNRQQSGQTGGRNLQQRTLAPGEFVFEEGDPGNYAYVLVSGELEICKLTAGKHKHLATVEVGALFGEMALIDSAPRSASVRAVSESVVREVDEKALMAHITKAPDVAINMLKRLASYVRTSNKGMDIGVFDIPEQANQEPVHKKSEQDIAGLARWKRDRDNRHIIEEFQLPAQELVNRPLPAIVTRTFLMMALLFVSLVVWASVSVIDTNVSARGRLSTTVPKITVQAADSSVVRSVHVEPGQHVSKGAVLATLDRTFADSDLKQLQSEYQQVLAEIERLQAEKSLKTADVTEIGNPLQREIYRDRIEEFNSRIAGFELATDRANSSLQQAQIALEVASIDLRTVQHELAKNQRLSEENIVSEKALVESRFKVEKAESVVEDAETSVIIAGGEYEKIQLDKQVYISEWHASVGKELSESVKKRDSMQEELIRLQRKSEDVTILAPVDGVVLELINLFEGAVVSSGSEVITIVPVDVPLTVEMDIEPHDIGNLVSGASVSVKLDALPYQKHNDLSAEIFFISEDTVNESTGGEEGVFYRARATITSNNLRKLPDNFRLIPGMQLTGDIRVGKRRLITYFIYPVIRTIETSFREP